MRTQKKLFFVTVILLFIFSFNMITMAEWEERKPKTPDNEVRHEDRSLDYNWVWISDDICCRFQGDETVTRENIEKKDGMGLTSRWGEYVNHGSKLKTRDIYTGKWMQGESGIWSFEFDDKTIPVGVTKIDNVLYAFNGYGELKEGYEYYEGLTTGADGLVTSEDPEFLKWLETQYVPACTSHE